MATMKRNESEEPNVATIGGVSFEVDSATVIFTEPPTDGSTGLQVIVASKPGDKKSGVVLVATAAGDELESEELLGSADISFGDDDVSVTTGTEPTEPEDDKTDSEKEDESKRKECDGKCGCKDGEKEPEDDKTQGKIEDTKKAGALKEKLDKLRAQRSESRSRLALALERRLRESRKRPTLAEMRDARMQRLEKERRMAEHREEFMQRLERRRSIRESIEERRMAERRMSRCRVR